MGTAETMRKMARNGLAVRLEQHVFEIGMTGDMRKTVAVPYHERVEYELGVIEQMGFSRHFLIVADIIQWMKAQNIQVSPGFGSVPGSAVAWALTITDIDPLRWGLFFERFLSPERVSIPDFYIGLCQKRWEECIRYVESKYGYQPHYVNDFDHEFPDAKFNYDELNLIQHPRFTFTPECELSQLTKAMDLIRQNRDLEIDLSSLPLDDPATYELLSKGEINGVFQLGSDVMREVLTHMKPVRLEDLMAVIALYRPGPMDQIPLYVACKNGDMQSDYLHPSLEPILAETYGILVYQEQVMQISQVLCGYTLGEGDLLRRALGRGNQKEVDEQRIRFLDRAMDRGFDQTNIKAIFDKLCTSSQYLFNKSHAAAYALRAYRSAWMKTNFPHEFSASLAIP